MINKNIEFSLMLVRKNRRKKEKLSCEPEKGLRARFPHLNDRIDEERRTWLQRQWWTTTGSLIFLSTNCLFCLTSAIWVLLSLLRDVRYLYCVFYLTSTIWVWLSSLRDVRYLHCVFYLTSTIIWVLLSFAMLSIFFQMEVFRILTLPFG